MQDLSEYKAKKGDTFLTVTPVQATTVAGAGKKYKTTLAPGTSFTCTETSLKADEPDVPVKTSDGTRLRLLRSLHTLQMAGAIRLTAPVDGRRRPLSFAERQVAADLERACRHCPGTMKLVADERGIGFQLETAPGKYTPTDHLEKQRGNSGEAEQV